MSICASIHIANISPSPQVLVSSLFSTDFSSSSAYCSSRARAFSPSPLTSWSTRGPSHCEVGWGSESSSALTVNRVSDRMLFISFWSSLGCWLLWSPWFSWIHTCEKHDVSETTRQAGRQTDRFYIQVSFPCLIWTSDYRYSIKTQCLSKLQPQLVSSHDYSQTKNTFEDVALSLGTCDGR